MGKLWRSLYVHVLWSLIGTDEDVQTLVEGLSYVQLREDGSTNFTPGWNKCVDGFGNVNREYWLGNEVIHQLTYETNYSLHIDMWDWVGRQRYYQWKNFRVAPETDFYRLFVTDFEGGTGEDSLTYQSGMQFSTFDRDNDVWFSHCAQKDLAGRWYKDGIFRIEWNVCWRGSNTIISGWISTWCNMVLLLPVCGLRQSLMILPLWCACQF